VEKRRRVRSGLPYDLREVNAVLATVHARIDELDSSAPPETVDGAADEIFRLHTLLRNLGSRPSITGCPAHPEGAVDPIPPMGWGRCLLCNHRRRSSGAPVPPPTSPAGTVPARRKMLPDFAHGLEELRSIMRTINDLVFDLKIESPPEAFDEIADYVHEAFCVAREFSRALPITGCKIHPQGAVDPDSCATFGGVEKEMPSGQAGGDGYPWVPCGGRSCRNAPLRLPLVVTVWCGVVAHAHADGRQRAATTACSDTPST